jgi:hypothetical protein
MAIEDDDIRDREAWTQIAHQWYLKPSDRSPQTGRLYHHLATPSSQGGFAPILAEFIYRVPF